MKNKIENLKIRQAKETDYEAVNVLYHIIYDMYHKKMPDFYKKQPQECLPKGTFINMLDSKTSLLLVAESNKNVVGVMSAEIEKEEADNWSHRRKRVRIEEVAVLPKYAHKGVGRELIMEAEQWAKKKKASSLILLAYDFNPEVIHFYETCGYQHYTHEMIKKIS